MKAMSLPGGATKGAGIAGAAVELIEQGFKPKAYGCISFGSVASVPLAIGMYEELLETSRTLQLRKFFTVPPTNEKGMITAKAAVRAACSFVSRSNKYLSFGVQDIRPILTSFITREKFLDYQRSSAAPCYIMAVDFQTNYPLVWNVKDKSITFEEYLAIVQASSRIPVMTQPKMLPLETIAKAVNYEGFIEVWKSSGVAWPRKFFCYDGGLVDHNMGARLVELSRVLENLEPITELASIYPRPSGFKIPPMPAPKNIADVILYTIENLKMEVSRGDEQREVELEEEGLKLTQVFNPWILESLYDVENERLAELQAQSRELAKKAYQASYGA